MTDRSTDKLLPGRLSELYDLTGQVAVITGGAGLLGRKHAAILDELGATSVLLDIDATALAAASEALGAPPSQNFDCNICDPEQVARVRQRILSEFGGVDILINNAAQNPKVEAESDRFSRLESFPIEQWREDLNVGLTGAFNCSKYFGTAMAEVGRGVILNMSSDLGLIGPDQRIYRTPGKPNAEQPVKPITYSVVKSGLIGLTRYLATYWASAGVRVNALAPGGVENGQDPDFVNRLNQLIPMGRMAAIDEYQAAVAFMVSDASSYMTGAVVSIDGGRTAW